jgi:hypothetical protein
MNERDLYGGWLRWFWLVVSRTDITDEVVGIPWYMGSIGALRGFRVDTLTFTVIPLNWLVHGCVTLYRWCRYCRPDGRTQELENSYRRGFVDGRANERAAVLSKLRKFDEIARKEPELEWRHVVNEYDHAVDLVRDVG